MATWKKKSPLIAAALNFFVWGLGYLYSGKRTVLGIGFLAAYIIFSAFTLTVIQLPPFPEVPYENLYAMTGILSILYQLMISMTLAYDVYRETKN